jgi:hypothetical protein
VFNTFSTGGIEPVSAIAITFTGEAEESLVVANEGDGLFTLLGGTEGLEEEQSLSKSYLPEPTALDLKSVSGDEVSFYATTAGMEAAFTLNFILPGFAPSTGPALGSSTATVEAPAMLVALSETSLALVASLLVTMLNTPLVTVLNTPTSATLAATAENQAEVNTSFLSVAPSQGQGLFAQFTAAVSGGDEAAETAPEAPAGEGERAPRWVRSLLNLDEQLQKIRQENHDALFEDEEPADTGNSPEEDLGDLFSRVFPSAPIPWANEADPGPSPAGRSPHAERADTQAVDVAIGFLWAVPPTDAPPSCTVSPQRASVWVPLVLATTLVLHGGPLAEMLRDRRRRGVEPRAIIG